MTAPAHPRYWLLAIVLATLSVLVLPTAARADTLGPAPVRCGGEDGGTAGGCYGSGADVMDDTWLADLHVEPHVVHVGEKLTATVAPLRDGVKWSWPVGDCADNAPACTWTARAATGGWALLPMSFPSPYGVGVEQDFYAVLEDLYAITGYVRDGEGKAVPGVAVAAAGTRGARATTNVNGFYTMQVPKGAFVVSAGGYCVAGASGCPTSKAVTTPGSRTVDFAQPPRHRLEGTVTATSCGETSCQVPTGLGNVTVTATAIDGGQTMTATTDGEGRYALDLVEGTYDVTPAFEERTFSPLDEVVRLRADRTGVDFRTCVPDAGAGRRLAAGTDLGPCIRLYRLDARAWIPYGGSFVDPLLTGASTIPGTDYPMTATSPSIFTLTRGWPACGDGKNPLPGTRQIDLKKAKATVTWRSRYVGHAHPGYEGDSLGGVGIPVLWDGERGKLTLLRGQTRETVGTVKRVYDYRIEPRNPRLRARAGTCTTTRKSYATYTARLLDDHTVELLVSWQLPFKTFEDVDDFLGLDKVVPDPEKATPALAEANWKAIEKGLERTDAWNALPDSAKEDVARDAKALFARGYSRVEILRQVDDVVEAFGGDRAALVGHPILKAAKKYVEILKKSKYPSMDLRLVVAFATGPNPAGLGRDTRITVQASADDFPSYGFRIWRRESSGLVQVPWPPNDGVDDPAGRMAGASPNVLVDPSLVRVAEGRVGLLRADRLQGGVGAKASLLAAMNVINNPISHGTPFVGGKLVGGVPRTLRWLFANQAS